MSAPDKIYLNIPKDSPAIYNNDVLEIATWSTKEFADCNNICYIRKDYLLEWAKEMKEQVGLGLNAYDMGEENGKAYMLNALLDKLNEI